MNALWGFFFYKYFYIFVYIYIFSFVQHLTLLKGLRTYYIRNVVTLMVNNRTIPLTRLSFLKSDSFGQLVLHNHSQTNKNMYIHSAVAGINGKLLLIMLRKKNKVYPGRSSTLAVYKIKKRSSPNPHVALYIITFIMYVNLRGARS